MKGGFVNLMGELAFLLSAVASLGLVFWTSACLVQAFVAAKQTRLGIVADAAITGQSAARGHMRNFVKGLVALSVALVSSFILSKWYGHIN